RLSRHYEQAQDDATAARPPVNPGRRPRTPHPEPGSHPADGLPPVRAREPPTGRSNPRTGTLNLTSSSLRAPASHLDRALARARGQERAALAAYLPAGYPTLDQSLDALHLLATTADVIEIGLPYSDPLMDGPLIQRAAEQALRAGFRTEHLFTTVRELA